MACGERRMEMRRRGEKMERLEKMSLMIANLDRVLETLQPMQQSIMHDTWQTTNPVLVDEYYNLLLAYERTKEARERLLTVFQKLQED